MLELSKLVLADALDELVGVSHDLGDQVVLVVVLKVIDLLEVFVVLLCNSFDICNEGLILQVEAPVLSVIVNSWLELWSLLLLDVR